MVIELSKREIACPVADPAQDQALTSCSKKISARKRKRNLKMHRLKTEQLKYLKGYEDQILRLAIALNETPSDPSNNDISLSGTVRSESFLSEHKTNEIFLEQTEIHAPHLITGQGMASLIDASIKTGDVTALFQDISNRINLFALKSALEASRSGEARGNFMQMAVELKDLAQETSDASCKLYAYMSNIQKMLSNTTHHMLDQYDNPEQPAIIAQPHIASPLVSMAQHPLHDYHLPQAGLSWRKISERIAETITAEDLQPHASENMDGAESVHPDLSIQNTNDHPPFSTTTESGLTVPVHELENNDLGLLAEQLTQSLNAIRIRRKI